MNIKELIVFMPAIEGGGVEKNLFIICNYLANKIKKVSLINSSRKFNKNFKKINIINPKAIFWDNYGRKGRYFICLLILFREIVKRNRNVVIFAFQANLYCIILCKILNVKVITRSNSSPSGWSKNYLKNLIFKNLLKISDSIIVNSFEFKRELKKKFNVNSTCIYNPLNKSEIIKKSKTKVRLNFFNKSTNYLKIINVGRFADQKDQITLLKALYSCKKNNLKFKLLCMGRGATRNQLINFIKKKNLTNEIKLMNFQKNPYKYIAKADLFILSSKFEGLPNVLLETACLKKFIISSDCPTGPKEILDNGKGGLLFKTTNYLDLANKILFFSKNRRKLTKKTSYAYDRLYRFDYKKNLQKYLNLVNYFLKD